MTTSAPTPPSPPASPPATIDEPRAVRPGEELPLDQLAAVLGAHDPALRGPVSALQFPSGHSNLTYLVRAGGRELVLRRPPFGAAIKTAHDMGREYRILRGLAAVYPKAPRPLLACDDPAVLGAPFYVMERVRGVILRGPRPAAAAGLGPDLMRRISTALVDTLAELHAVDPAAAGLADLGHPAGYVARQVAGWTDRYLKAKTDEVPEVEAAAAWLAAHLPPERGTATLIHNDYKYDNVVLDAADLARVVAVLDWEMATIGDPLMDLGTTLGYWIDADDPPEHQALPFGPTMLPGNLTRVEVVARYAERTGRAVDEVLFYYVFALLKIAVIAQQIYRRFQDGHSRDPRFAGMIVGVRILGATAARALDRGRIDRLG